jgi:hypothetical protein
VRAQATLALGLVAGLTLAAQAEIVTLSPVKDNTIFENPNGDIANGAGWGIFVGRIARGTGLRRRGLLDFDVASTIPAGSTITAVRLTLQATKTAGGGVNIGLHRVTSDWGEGASDSGPVSGGGGGLAQPGDATWIHTFHTSSLWTTPGGDFVSLASATRSVSGIGTYVWGTTAGMVADVQLWLDNPDLAFGWMLKAPETSQGNAKRFAAREHETAAWRPQLEIEYTPVPAPSAAALLLALAAPAFRRRR